MLSYRIVKNTSRFPDVNEWLYATAILRKYPTTTKNENFTKILQPKRSLQKETRNKRQAHSTNVAPKERMGRDVLHILMKNTDVFLIIALAAETNSQALC